MKIPLFLIFLLFACTSCGYRFGAQGVIDRGMTLSLPYVEGDKDGAFTSALIYALSKSPTAKYSSCDGDFTLKVCLLPPGDDNIGFKYAPEKNKKKKVTNILAAEEARLTLIAKVTLIDNRCGKCIFGPIEIGTSLAYDFEPDFSNVDFHAFALGQLEMHPLAKDAAFCPLYQRLAQKIIDTLEAS